MKILPKLKVVRRVTSDDYTEYLVEGIVGLYSTPSKMSTEYLAQMVNHEGSAFHADIDIDHEYQMTTITIYTMPSYRQRGTYIKTEEDLIGSCVVSGGLKRIQ